MEPSVSFKSAVVTHGSCGSEARLESHFKKRVSERSDVERPQRKTERSVADLERPLQGVSETSLEGEGMMMMADIRRVYEKDGWHQFTMRIRMMGFKPGRVTLKTCLLGRPRNAYQIEANSRSQDGDVYQARQATSNAGQKIEVPALASSPRIADICGYKYHNTSSSRLSHPESHKVLFFGPVSDS